MDNSSPPRLVKILDKGKDETSTQPVNRTFMQSMAAGWLRLTGPKSSQFGSSMQEQELLRRSHLLSALLFCGIVVIILIIPTTLAVPIYWIPTILYFSFGLISLIINRTSRVTIAGTFYICAIDVTLIVLMLTLPTGIRNSNIPDFDLFLIPVIISGVILPKRFIPFIVIIHIIAIIALFSILPHDRLLTQEILINQHGSTYAELSDAFIIQVVGGAIAWLSAWSVDRALLRANRAEDLAEARQRLNEQAAAILEQKQRLDYGIDVIKNAQARYSNGDFAARARLQDNELAPLAMSFNLLAERINHVTQVAQDYTRLENAVQKLLEVQNAMFYGGTVQPYQPSGTVVDRLWTTLQRYQQISELMLQSVNSVEKIRVDTMLQKNQLFELNSAISHIHTLALSLPTHNDPKEAGRISTQIQLIDQAQHLCTQFDKQNKQVSQEVKLLTQSLKRPLIRD